MNKRTLALLERAYTQEIESALSGGLDIIQTKSKLAEKLCEDGYLEYVVYEIDTGGKSFVEYKGYVLTHAGRMAYCAWAATLERDHG